MNFINKSMRKLKHTKYRQEKLRQGLLTVADEPLFRRYLVIKQGMGDTAKRWAPILSSKRASVI